ncbi:MAG: T9SS type A sorting domain-containing protein [Agriterribacter sp.]
MKTFFSIPLMIAVGYLLPKVTYSQTTYVDNGTSATYTLQTGDSLYIKQGTFTGTLNDWNQGGKVTVASGATFKPSSVNGYRSKYVVYGTMTVSSLSTEGGFGLKNYGTVTVNGSTQMNGTAQTWINNTGASISFNGSVAINIDGSSITNYADIVISSDFNLYGNSTIANKKNLTIAGNFNSSKGTFNNEGKFYSQKKITFSGSTVYTNTCRTIADNGITIDNSAANIYNSGILWATTATNTSTFTNSGTIISSANGVIKTVTFTNYGSIKGNGFMYITGKSTLGSSAYVGTNGTTADSLKIYTVNRTKTTQIFDDQWGTVYPNAKYATFAAPDTTGFSAYSCAAEYTSLSLLPVSWNDFSVKLSNNIPVINWSASFDDGTIFIVQRSNNGIDFSSVVSMKGAYGVQNYSFNDNTLPSNHNTVIYYRVCAIEPSGLQKYTSIKSVKFDASAVAANVFAKPNPFTNRFTINYQSAQKENITIKVFNINAQVQLLRNVLVSAGNNTVSITDTDKWANGMYIIQVITPNGVMQSGKIIKQ